MAGNRCFTPAASRAAIAKRQMTGSCHAARGQFRALEFKDVKQAGSNPCRAAAMEVSP